MLSFSLPSRPNADTWFFSGIDSPGVGWRKPPNRSMAHILCIGAGGGGGTGVIGANSLSGGGGGGGSGAQTCVLIPLVFLPEVIYITAPSGIAGAGGNTLVTVWPNGRGPIVRANGGGVGGNASAGTGGTAGTAGAVVGGSGMYLGWQFVTLALAGQAGTAGGNNGNTGGDLTYSTTGLMVTGGTGGGGLAGAAGTGIRGGNIQSGPVDINNNGVSVLGGAQTNASTDPANPGTNGFYYPGFGYLFASGGTGASSTGGSVSGGNLIQGRGGDGAPGCGGGGSGGALTGSAAAVQSRGGNGLVIITCW